MIPHKGMAVAELVGGQITQKFGGTIVYNSGQTHPTEAEIDTKLAELTAAYDAQAYARNRKAEYDALNQLELMSDDDVNGTTTHKDAIAAIKAKWPKDNSGPV